MRGRSIEFYSRTEFNNQLELYQEGGMSYEEALSNVLYNERQDANYYDQYVMETTWEEMI